MKKNKLYLVQYEDLNNSSNKDKTYVVGQNKDEAIKSFFDDYQNKVMLSIELKLS